MNNTLYFLRHGKTKVDPDTPISQWALAIEGEQQAKDLAEKNTFNDVQVIYTSTEQKAINTAQPIAEKLGLPIQQEADLSELNRDQGKFVPPKKYEQLIEQALLDPDRSTNNWEPAATALARFESKIQEIDRAHQNQHILIVGHGFTINLYFAKLLNKPDQVHQRLNTNDFGDWGVVKNGNVIKDIAKK